MRIKTIALALILSMGLSGCFTDEKHGKKNSLAAGAVVGAVVGGLLGFNLIGKGEGRWIGALLVGGAGAAGGYWAADYLSSDDRMAMRESAHEGLTQASTGQTVSWVGEASGAHGSFTPTRTFLNKQGQICREFTVKVQAGEINREGNQIACRRSSGDWVIS